MISPSREDFVKLCDSWTVVPVWRELLADLTTPVAAFLRLAGSGRTFMLESAEHGGRSGRWSFIGRNPPATLIARGLAVTVEGEIPYEIPTDRGILAAVEHLLAKLRSPDLEGLPPLHGGLVGYLGYDVTREIENLGPPPPGASGFPDAILSIAGEIIAYDSWLQRVKLIEAVIVPPGAGIAVREQCYDDAAARLNALAEEGAHPAAEPLVEPPSRGDDIPEYERRTSPVTYVAAVEAARDQIRAGEVFQVVVSQRFDLTLGADPFDFYRSLRQVNPSPYMFYLRHPEVSVIGSSPEPLVQLRGGRVVSRPIAGTRFRGRDPAHDARLAAELSESPKERAEHIMLVDLARNDVGRVSEFGTVKVDELMTVERFSHVMHMTSQVSGVLRRGLGPVDVLRATMPAGTVSGAPKLRAMELIDDLEATKRGPYAGIVGYVDFSGGMDTAIAIRTMLVAPDGTASVQAGAGIVVDSDPAEEDLECANKAAALLTAVSGARRINEARGDSNGSDRAASPAVRRPA